MAKGITKKQYKEAIMRAAGNMSAAAQMLSVSRQAVRLQVEKHPDLKQSVEEARETLIDMAESKLTKAVKDGDMTAIIFTLKTQGKHRGWVERHEIGLDKDTEILVNYKRTEEEPAGSNDND